jgi:hypothetical protein
MINAGKFCSRACRNRAHPPTGPCPQRGVPGPRNGAWKGGVTLKRPKGNYGGVRHVRAPAWVLPMARADGYIAEHRLVMATMAGRLLTRTEVVHHRDHDPSNNSKANLEMWPDNQTHKLAEHGRPVNGEANLLRG